VDGTGVCALERREEPFFIYFLSSSLSCKVTADQSSSSHLYAFVMGGEEPFFFHANAQWKRFVLPLSLGHLCVKCSTFLFVLSPNVVFLMLITALSSSFFHNTPSPLFPFSPVGRRLIPVFSFFAS